MLEIEHHLKKLERQHAELEGELSSPQLASEPRVYQKIAKKHSNIGKILKTYARLKDLEK